MTRSRLMLVDDDALLASSLSKALERAGFEVVYHADPEAALRWLRTQRPDALILDVDLQADRTGLELCHLLRNGGWTGEYSLLAADFASVPILMLTGKSAFDDKLNAYEAGSNDYVTKRELYAEPDVTIDKRNLDVRLLVAHLRELLPGDPVSAPAPATVRVGELMLYLDQETAVLGATKLQLTRTEYEVLCWLVSHAGVVQSRATLLREVWGFPTAEKTRLVDVCVSRLRKKLDAAGGCDLIQAEHGVGYLFVN